MLRWLYYKLRFLEGQIFDDSSQNEMLSCLFAVTTLLTTKVITYVNIVMITES